MKRLVLLFALFCSSAALAEELPISGAYGDEKGCLAFKERQFNSDSGTYLHAKGLRGYEWSCTFANVWQFDDFEAPGKDKSWAAIAMCSSEGISYSRLLTIQMVGDRAIISNATETKNVDGLDKCG